MEDNVEKIFFYQKAITVWDLFWDDCEKLFDDVRGREIAKQLTRSCGSISANIEEGYGRGFGKEYPQFLHIARGSARETKGWYARGKKLFGEKIVAERTQILNEIIAMISKAIITLENKQKKK